MHTTPAPTLTFPPQVGTWTSHIIEGALKKLAALQKPMKYICHVSLTQRAGAGLHAASCSRWNQKTDGVWGLGGWVAAHIPTWPQRWHSGVHAALPTATAGLLSVHWESQTVLALVTVFWVAL